MVKWWMKCICDKEDVKKPVRRDPSDTPLKSLPALQVLSRKGSVRDQQRCLVFDVSDVKQLEELLEEINEAIEIAHKKRTRKNLAPKTVTANVNNAEEVLNQVTHFCLSVGTQAPLSKVATESYKVLSKILQELGNLHWAAAGLSMVAFVLNRFDRVGENVAECLNLLETMRDLGEHLVALYPRLPEHNEKLQRAICFITEGAVMCCLHMDSGLLNRFTFATVDKDSFVELRNKIYLLYPDLTLTVNETILAQTAILLRQSSIPLSPLKPEYPTNKVGLDERVDAVLKMLGLRDKQDLDPGVRAVVLHGMGGIGKSTLGMALHAKLPFVGRAHAKVEVGECPTKEKIRDCQRDILVRLSGQKISIGDCSEGRQKLGTYLQDCTEPMLLLIDNIFKGEDLEELLPDRLVLPDGSRIIVTSRDASVCAVLDEKGVNCQPYPVAELGQAQAKKLLCMQVFNGLDPPPDRQIQVIELLNICGGLPLALEVVGRYLRRHKKSDRAWSLAIESLQKCRPVSGKKEDQLYQSLYFSYNQLAEDYQRAFLDITCLFADTPWDWVEPIYGEKLVTLEELALVKKVDDGDGFVRLQVHDLLVALGRSIQTGTLIWSDAQDEIPHLLQQNYMGIEGIFIRNCSEPILAEKLDTVHKSLRILILQDIEVLGKCCRAPEGLQLCITTNGVPYTDLGKLKELQVLIMSHDTDFEFKNVEFPRHLKVLILVEVRTLVYLPAAFGDLTSLHTLEISWCHALRELPDTFGQLSCLRTLVLTGCKKLKELPRFFESLHSLKILDLCYCEQLEKLPTGFGQLAALQRLDLCGCKSLRKLSDDFAQLKFLQVLHLGDCKSLEALPKDFGNLVNLQDLNLTRCKSLEKLPDGFEMLGALRNLSLEHCHRLLSLPKNFGQLSSLVTLRLSDCPCIQELPPSFLQLRRLSALDVSCCSFLNMNVLEELKQQQECRIVCENIDYFDTDNESVQSIYYESTDLEEHDLSLYYESSDGEDHDGEDMSLYS